MNLMPSISETELVLKVEIVSLECRGYSLYKSGPDVYQQNQTFLEESFCNPCEVIKQK